MKHSRCKFFEHFRDSSILDAIKCCLLFALNPSMVHIFHILYPPHLRILPSKLHQLVMTPSLNNLNGVQLCQYFLPWNNWNIPCRPLTPGSDYSRPQYSAWKHICAIVHCTMCIFRTVGVFSMPRPVCNNQHCATTTCIFQRSLDLSLRAVCLVVIFKFKRNISSDQMFEADYILLVACQMKTMFHREDKTYLQKLNPTANCSKNVLRPAIQGRGRLVQHHNSWFHQKGPC